jgi:hypothetical protein
MRIARLPPAVLILMQAVACSGKGPVAPGFAPTTQKPTPTVASAEPVEVSTASATAPIILSLPDESPGPPVYAGIARFFMNTDGEWVAIELIRERRCIPENFNLFRSDASFF